MKRMCLALVAGAVLIGTGVPATAAPADGPQKAYVLPEPLKGKATQQDWINFFEAVGDVQATLAQAEQAMTRVGAWRYHQCKFQSLDHGLWTAREERLTAACVNSRWHAPGGLSEVMSVGSCESGWNREAVSSSGTYVGLFQQHEPSWDDRLAAWSPTHWGLKSDWRNSRSMIVVSIRMAHADGDWGQWAGCA